MTSTTPQENYLAGMINRAQFDVYTPTDLGLVIKNKMEKIFALEYS